MNYEQACVRAFHKKFGLKVSKAPRFIDDETFELRRRLIQEEFDELIEANKEKNIVKIADALGDLLYVVYGTAVSYGIDMEDIFATIHDANMRKEGGALDNGGKLIKPEGFEEPDIASLILDQQR